MKALILTMTSGDGHNIISRTIARHLDARGAESKIVDIYRSRKFSHWFNSVGYIIANKYFRPVYRRIYRISKYRPSEKRWKGGVVSFLRPIEADILSEIASYRPDFVLAPHPYTAALVSLFKHEKKIPSSLPVYGILTDLFPHAYWETAVDCDKIFVPSLCCAEEMAWKGIPRENLAEVGFPVNDRFFERRQTSEARQALGLGDCFTVLLSSGGFGTANNFKIVKQLLKSDLPLQILNMNSRNKRGKKRVDRLIRRKKLTNVKNFGYVEDVALLMEASDVIVCKGGCSTLFEAMAVGLPIVVRECIINNEVENADYLQSLGICLRMSRPADARRFVERLANDPALAADMRAKSLAFARPGCVEKMLDDVGVPARKFPAE